MVKWSMQAELAIKVETILLSNGSVWLLRGAGRGAGVEFLLFVSSPEAHPCGFLVPSPIPCCFSTSPALAPAWLPPRLEENLWLKG